MDIEWGCIFLTMGISWDFHCHVRIRLVDFMRIRSLPPKATTQKKTWYGKLIFLVGGSLNWGEVVALEFVETIHLAKGHGTEISSYSLGKPEREPYKSQVYLGFWMSDPKVQCAPTPLPTGSIIYVPTFTINFPPNVGQHAILTWILWVSRWIISRYWLNIYELTTRWRGEYCPSNSSKLTDLEFGSTPEWCKMFGPSIISTVPLDFQTNSPEQIILRPHYESYQPLAAAHLEELKGVGLCVNKNCPVILEEWFGDESRRTRHQNFGVSIFRFRLASSLSACFFLMEKYSCKPSLIIMENIQTTQPPKKPW